MQVYFLSIVVNYVRKTIPQGNWWTFQFPAKREGSEVAIISVLPNQACCKQWSVHVSAPRKCGHWQWNLYGEQNTVVEHLGRRKNQRETENECWKKSSTKFHPVISKTGNSTGRKLCLLSLRKFQKGNGVHMGHGNYCYLRAGWKSKARKKKYYKMF